MPNTALPIPLYTPNLIGYLRLALILTCLFIPTSQLYLLITFIVLAGLLDNLDGFVARRWDQYSQYGAVLDYLTDRVTVFIYIKLLSDLYPSWVSLFYLIFMVDMASHMGRLYLGMWLNESHHKKVKSRFKLLNYYYPTASVSWVMGFCTHSYELFLIAIMLLAYPPAFAFNGIVSAIAILSFPGFFLKNMVHLLQLIECFYQSLLYEKE